MIILGREKKIIPSANSSYSDYLAPSILDYFALYIELAQMIGPNIPLITTPYTQIFSSSSELDLSFN